MRPVDITVPAEWQAALSRVRLAGFHDAVIAGGCLRDLDHGKPVKDVDIFVSLETFQKAKAGEHAFPELLDDRSVFEALRRNVFPGASYDVVVSLSEEVGDYALAMASRDVCGVYDCDPPDEDVTYQVIVQARPIGDHEKFLEGFDFGICRILYDGLFVKPTVWYMGDREKKQFTLLEARCDASRERSLKRYKRLSAKYPGWPMVDAA